MTSDDSVLPKLVTLKCDECGNDFEVPEGIAAQGEVPICPRCEDIEVEEDEDLPDREEIMNPDPDESPD